MKTFHLVTLFISWDAQNKQNGVLFWILAVAIYIMEASFIRTRTRKLIMKWQAEHPWLQDTEKKLWFIVNHCGYFFGKCGASFRVSENYTGQVDFESCLPDWQVQPVNISFQCCIVCLLSWSFPLDIALHCILCQIW